MLDRQRVGGAYDLLHEARELGRIRMRVAARETAADIDGIDDHAGVVDQLPDLLDRLAEGGWNHRLRAHMEGDAEPARDLARAQQQSRRLGARHTELAFQRNEAVRVGTGKAEEQVEVVR